MIVFFRYVGHIANPFDKAIVEENVAMDHLKTALPAGPNGRILRSKVIS